MFENAVLFIYGFVSVFDTILITFFKNILKLMYFIKSFFRSNIGIMQLFQTQKPFFQLNIDSASLIHAGDVF